MDSKPMGMTGRLADFIVNTRSSDIPSEIFEHAKVAFLDWIGVTLAGKDDPLVLKLIELEETMGGRNQATIIGHGQKKTVAQAALINGSASHALDYDDSLIPFLGHPSVTLFPALLALCEWKQKSGRDFLTAYLIGLKTGVTIGSCAGLDHYLSGYHGTSTIGTMASAAACARLMGLDLQKTVYALGIAGTQAGGLKLVFGTMCKPFHAGRASQIGLISSLLAQNDFTSTDNILEGPSGFFQTLKGAVNEEVVKTLGQTWVIENLAQKYHASCHATHSPIEASLAIVQREKLPLEQIRAINVFVSQTALSAAFKNEAVTGLEGKFSIPYCVANALLRGNTGLQAFTDEKVNDEPIKNFLAKIHTHQDPGITALDARVEVETRDGKTFSAYSDIFKEIPELAIKKEKIKAKFSDLSAPFLGPRKTEDLFKRVSDLENVSDMGKLSKLML
ncbi:MAG: MmgE/PrpD family protein [Deltaproteobacteria bacterium]|nr:MmgE/PrpD family protein [Deltaproteobacteria bacterium]